MTVNSAALIVGGGTGIGYATAHRLLARGVAVTISGRREAVLAEAQRSLIDVHPDGSLAIVVGDCSQAEEANRVVETALAESGRLDICINCAGIYEPVHVLQMDAPAWRRTMDANLEAAIYPSLAAARVMAAAKGGRFILLASTSAPLSEPEALHYSAGKAAVESIARSLAVDLAAYGVTANAVAPGWIHTDMSDDFVRNATPESLANINILGRVGQPDEVANLIEYLALDAPTYLNAATIFIDGGQTAMAPLI